MSEIRKTDFRPRDRWLIASVIGGPTAWFLHLNISYALVPETCDRGTKMFLHVVTLTCIVLALVSAFIAWKIRGEFADGPHAELWQERTRWVATFALVLCLSMVLVIIAQEIPNLLLRSCD